LFTEPGSARQEAERLVAAVLAAATMAANANPQLSTGSAECCVCPLCKVIAAVRDPDPQMVDRLTAGAGDLAAGVASFLRHVASPGSNGGDPWHAATSTSAGDAAGGDAPASKAAKPMAKKTVAKKATAPAASADAPKKTVVKKTVAKKAAPAKKTPPIEER
jgi:hypothetical protein